MRIAIISPGKLPIPVTKGGAVETLIQYIIDQNENEKKLDITVFSIFDHEASHKSNVYTNTNFNFIKINKPMYLILHFVYRLYNKIFSNNIDLNQLYLKQIIKKIKQTSYDAIVIENEPLMAPQISKYLNIKTKLYIHLHNEHLSTGLKKHEVFAKFPNRVIVVSDYLGNIVRQTGCYNNFKDIVTLKNCADIDRFSSKELNRLKKEKLRRKYGFDVDAIIIMFCGRIIQEKGVRELIEAFKNLKTNKKVQLVIVGSSWFSSCDMTDYMREVKRLSADISDKIVFTGFVPHENIQEVYNCSDLNVIPSIWNDPAPLSVIEAMAAGLPIVVTKSGGIPEYADVSCALFIERDSDLVSNLRKSLEILINNDEKRNLMGENAKRCSKQFGVEQYYNNFVRILKDE